MNKFMKKAAAFFLGAAMMTGLCACGKKDAKKEDVPITSTWKFDHLVQNGEEIPLPEKETVMIPQFSTDDGNHFLFSITGTSYFEGDLTALEDGTYELRQGSDESIFSADIEGDELTITISGENGSSFVFVAEDTQAQ